MNEDIGTYRFIWNNAKNITEMYDTRNGRIYYLRESNKRERDFGTSNYRDIPHYEWVEIAILDGIKNK